jgi:ubiquinone/menaquinone biosynthesis C-methylase UbiE
MKLDELKQHWDCFGQTDPLWAILTAPGRKTNRWNTREFFATGEGWIANLMRELEAHGLNPRGRCLEFGCGVGRLTQALCEYFESCDGVDIAPSMIRLAKRYNRHPDRCRYHLNDAPDLRLFRDRTFDFVCSIIVLQHIEPQYTKRYIADFVRVLKPDGIAVFQVPSAILPAAPALPALDYQKARITPALQQLVTYPNQSLRLRVRVRNDTSVTWVAADEGGRLRLGNHWRSADGSLIQNDDGRAGLPQLKPGEEVVVALPVTAPEAKGRFILEIDLVEEGITWFSQRGLNAPCIRVTNRLSLTQRLLSRVVAPEQSASEKHISLTPVMEMHCVPKEEVLALVSASGARVLHVIKDWAGGEGYESYHYIITRPSIAAEVTNDEDVI